MLKEENKIPIAIADMQPAAANILANIYQLTPSIADYFARFNAGDFKGVAGLFTESGCLKPPFDRPICGRDEIAFYLNKEAIEMKIMPESGKVITSDLTGNCYAIYGKVETIYFSLNLMWSFQIDANGELAMLEIKLLASVAELLPFERNSRS